MEDEDIKIEYPYYETTYIDDDKARHLAKVKPADLEFYKDRFTVLSTEYKLTD